MCHRLGGFWSLLHWNMNCCEKQRFWGHWGFCELPDAYNLTWYSTQRFGVVFHSVVLRIPIEVDSFAMLMSRLVQAEPWVLLCTQFCNGTLQDDLLRALIASLQLACSDSNHLLHPCPRQASRLEPLFEHQELAKRRSANASSQHAFSRSDFGTKARAQATRTPWKHCNHFELHEWLKEVLCIE